MAQIAPAELAEAVDGARLMEQVRALSRWVKLSGTPGELEAVHHVEGVLRGFGYRTAILMHDALISLPGDARVAVNGQAIRCITHSHSRPSPQGGLKGELVYLGSGSAADFAKTDVAGRIAVIEGIAKPEQTARASRAGAIGQIHIDPTEYPHEMCISPVWGSPSLETRAELPKTVVVTIRQSDGAALRERLQRSEKLTAEISAAVDTRWVKTPILTAELDAPEPEPGSPFLLFSGHIDTWHYGVMDNGSANATMMEVARLCAERRQAWRRGLRLCFWSGHSHGRYSGSTWYADSHWHELNERCVAHVNVDSTGGKGAVMVTKSGSAAELRALATEAVATHAGQTYGGRRVGRQGDESFWGVGIPAMFGSLSHQAPPADGSPDPLHLGWWWHTPEDLIDKIDEANLVRDTKIFAHVVWRLIADPALPLDYSVYAADLLAELEKSRPLAGDIPLDDVIGQTRRLAELAAATASAPAARRDAALLKVSRALVPIDSTKGDRFVHDPALPQSGWPTLDPLRRLAAMDANAPERPFAVVSAMRACNRVGHALREANAALEALRR